MLFEVVPDDGRFYAVRYAAGVGTIETDCPSKAAALAECGRLRRAHEAEQQRLRQTILDENEREVARNAWTGQGRLF